MVVFCTRCGSRNHVSYDCQASDQKLSPPPERPKEVLGAPGGAADTKNTVLESGLGAARWLGGPKMCRMVNLPSFPTKSAAEEFLDGLCLPAKRFWECAGCGGWHAEAFPKGPSQDGAERKPLPAGFVPFRRKPMRESAFGDQPDLPKRRAEPAQAEPEPVKRKAAPKKVEGMLF